MTSPTEIEGIMDLNSPEIKTLTEVNANLSLNPKDTAFLLETRAVETNGAGALLDVKKDENGCEGDEESNSILDQDDDEEEDGNPPDAKIAKLSGMYANMLTLLLITKKLQT